jgi:hypothetical protein
MFKLLIYGRSNHNSVVYHQEKRFEKTLWIPSRFELRRSEAR